MNVQPVLKLPFRLARRVVRTVREVVAPAPDKPTPTVPEMPRPKAPAPPPAPPRPVIAVRVEETPNPDARKFVCSVTVVAKGSVIANGPDQAGPHAFARALFQLSGVRTVFATRDFVTVTRASEGPPWHELQDDIERVLRDTVGR